MNKEKVVNGLIANEATPWTEENRDMLMSMTEEQLTVVVGNEEEAPADKPAENEDKPEDKPEEKKPEEKPEDKPADNEADNEALTVDQYIANAPEGMQGVLRAGLKSHEDEKKGLITKITANERNPFTAEQLQVKSLDELRGLVQLASSPEDPAPVQEPHFGGQGPVKPVENKTGVEEPLEAPALNFEGEK